MVETGGNKERIKTIIHAGIGWVIDGHGHIDINATQGINAVDDGAKINQNVVIDRHTQVILHSLHGQGSTPDRIISGRAIDKGRVDTIPAMTRDQHI